MLKSAGKYLVYTTTVCGLRWNTFTAPLERDEGEYAYCAWLLSEGDLPYESAFSQKPPLIFYTYLLGQLVTDHAVWAPRLLASLFILISGVLLGRIARHRFSETLEMPVALIFYTIMSLPIPLYWIGAANTEVFMLLPLIALMALFELAQPGAKGVWLGSGALAAAAMLYKPIALVPVLMIFLDQAFRLWKRQDRVVPILCNGATAVLAATGIGLLALAPFLMHDGGRSFWESAVAYNLEYMGTHARWPHFLRNMIFLVSHFLPLILLALAALFLDLRRAAAPWAIVALTAWSISGAQIPRYYVVVFPLLTLLAGQGMLALANRFRSASAASIPFTAVVMIALLLPHWELIRATPKRYIAEIYATHPFLEAELIAEKLVELSTSDDLVYMAGSETQVLYLARRKSATRFTMKYPLMLPTPRVKEYQSQDIQELEERAPRFIVTVKKNERWLRSSDSPVAYFERLDAYMHQAYELIGGARREGHEAIWVSGFAARTRSNALSMLLYRRKDAPST